MSNKTEKSYIYFTEHATLHRTFKIGETSNLETRGNNLWSQERMRVARYVSFDGTKDERLFIEAYLRSKYSANRNLAHFGNDHFTARTQNNLRGAENKFFLHVAEAFALLEIIKNKKYEFKTNVGRYNRWADLLADWETL